MGEGSEVDEASLKAKPAKKGWRDVRPWAPLKMFREKDVFLTCVGVPLFRSAEDGVDDLPIRRLTFNSICYT